jgi:hypothetical protein
MVAISIFLAKYFGLYFLLLAILFILQPNQYKTAVTGFAENPALVMMSGVTTLMLGLFLVLIHTVLVPDWRLLVTIICWIIFIKGWCLLACPKAMLSYSKKKMAKKSRMYGVIVIYVILALVFLYFGYCDRLR